MKRFAVLCLLLASVSCDRPAIESLDSEVTSPLSADADSAIVREAPDFMLPSLDGDSLRLSSLRGRVVVLNFWATWCAPCLYEMPALSKMHAALSADGLTVLGVSMDVDRTGVVRHFAARVGAAYPILLGHREMAAGYGGVFALPMTFLIDEQGIIRRRYVGLFNVDALQNELDAYLSRRNS